MSHHGTTNRETETCPEDTEDQGEREEDIAYIPRNLFTIHQSIRSEISMSTDPQSGSFDVTGFTRLGGNNDATRNLAYAQKPEASFDFENQKFSAIENRPPLLAPSLFNEGERLDIEDLTDDLGRYPLIDVNEPTPNFPPLQAFTNTSDITALPQNMSSGNTSDENTEAELVPNRYEKQHIFSMFAHGSCAPQTGDNVDTDRKPAAVDSILEEDLTDQYYDSSQQLLYPIQDLNGAATLNSNLNQSLQDRAEEEELDQRKPPPITSSAHPHDQSFPGTRSTRSNLKPPPEASHPAQQQRRSSRRITARGTRKRARSNNLPSTGTKSKRQKSGAKSKAKTNAKPKLAPKMSFLPSATQLVEANTQRKADALQTWFKRFEELVNFVDDYGHANVPQQFKENHSLGIWVNKQRMEKKAKDEGKSTSLTDEKVEMLEKVGFIWAKRKGQSAWEEKFRELQDYKLKHGTCNVPTKNKHNRALGRWVSTQRANYKRLQQGNPPKQRRTDWEEAKRRIRRLNGIGFAWSLLPTSIENGDEQQGRRSNDSKKRKQEEEEQNDDGKKKQKGDDGEETEEE